ncbi:MAG: tetratricopeptide repeat protein [Candidatus Gastranaerophilales bacterium]|nr:tetratricopeptide repeat protein [Candidatus Gastranaerophilales bacterium]
MDNYKHEKFEYFKKSIEFKKQKKYKEAIEMLHKVLEHENRTEDTLQILSQLGDLYILIGSYDRALDQFQKALSIQPNHEYSIQQCFEISFKTNQLSKALKIATQMCENNKVPKSYHNYLRVLIAQEKYTDAFQVFNSLDESIKLDVDILYLIATISGDKKEIVLKKILEIEQAHPSANADLAKIAYDRGEYNKVVQYCLNAEEDNPITTYYLAKIESIRHNYIRSIELYLKAIEYDEDEHDFYIDLAKAYIDVSWFDDAMVALKKSINMSIAKNHCENLDEKQFLAAWILIKQGQNSKALLNLNNIKKDSELYSKAQILIQVINLQNANVSDVVSKLEKYYQEEKDNMILLDTLALAYKELKLYKKAIEIYQATLKKYPNSIYYNLELIDLLIDDKRCDEAFEIINKIKDSCQKCPAIHNSLARIYYRLKEYEKALFSIDEFLKLDANKAETHYFKGLILNDLQRYKEAKDSIYNAIRINPTLAKYYSQMARSYVGINEYENALLYVKEAIEIEPNEINYKKQAYDISISIGNEEQIKMFKKQLERSEKILKLKR